MKPEPMKHKSTKTTKHRIKALVNSAAKIDAKAKDRERFNARVHKATSQYGGRA